MDTTMEPGACDPPSTLLRVKEDRCTCACLYLNGIFVGCLIQTFVVIGWLLSAGSLGDCKYVTVNLGDNSTLGGEFFEFPETMELGFFTFAKPNGDCYWYDVAFDADRQFEWYIEEFTNDWEVARAFAAFGFGLGFVAVMVAGSLCCTTYIRPVRYVMAFLIAGVLATVQGLGMLTLSTTFCDENNCEPSRSGWFGIGAVIFYFIAGVCFLFLSDYPGAEAARAQSQELEMAMNPTLATHYSPSPYDDPVTTHAEARVLIDESGQPMQGTAFAQATYVQDYEQNPDKQDGIVVGGEIGQKEVAQVVYDDELHR